MRKSVDAVVCDVMLWLSARLEGTDWDQLVSQDDLRDRLRTAVQRGELIGRINEIHRIKTATLDADSDVWSLNDEYKVIPLTERLKSVVAEWDRRTKPVQSAAASPLEYSEAVSTHTSA